MKRLLASAAFAFTVAACAWTNLDEARPYRCTTNGDCRGGYVCGGDNFCVDPGGETLTFSTSEGATVGVDRVSPEFVPDGLPEHVVGEDRFTRACGTDYVGYLASSVTWISDGGIQHFTHWETGQRPSTCPDPGFVDSAAGAVPAGTRVLAAAPLHQDGGVLLTTNNRGDCTVFPTGSTLAIACRTDVTPVDFDRLVSERTESRTWPPERYLSVVGSSSTSNVIAHRSLSTDWTAVSVTALDGGARIPLTVVPHTLDTSEPSADLVGTETGLYIRRRNTGTPPYISSESPTGWEPVWGWCEEDAYNGPGSYLGIRKIRGADEHPSLALAQHSPGADWWTLFVVGWNSTPTGPWAPCGPIAGADIATRPQTWYRDQPSAVSVCGPGMELVGFSVARTSLENQTHAFEAHCRVKATGELYVSLHLDGEYLPVPDAPQYRRARRIFHEDPRVTVTADDLGHAWFLETAPTDYGFGLRFGRTQPGLAPRPFLLDDVPVTLYLDWTGQLFAFTGERTAAQGGKSLVVQRPGVFALREGLGFASLHGASTPYVNEPPRGWNRGTELAVFVDEDTQQLALGSNADSPVARSPEGDRELARGPFQAAEVFDANGNLRLYVVTAYDTVLVAVAGGATFPLVLKPKLVPASRGGITSLAMLRDTRRADGTRAYALGYLVASDRLFQISASSQYVWSSEPIPVSEQPIAVFVDRAGRGRVGLGDGRILALPDRFVLAPAFPTGSGRAVSYAEVCGNLLALTSVEDGSDGRLYRIVSGASGAQWKEVPLPTAELPARARQFSGGKLLGTAKRAFVFLRSGIALEVTGLTCAL